MYNRKRNEKKEGKNNQPQTQQLYHLNKGKYAYKRSDLSRKEFEKIEWKETVGKSQRRGPFWRDQQFWRSLYLRELGEGRAGRLTV